MDIWNALEHGEVHVVMAALKHQPDMLKSTDCRGRTPLIWASLGGHVELVRLLLDMGSAIDHGDSNGFTALHWASCHGCTPLVRLLLERGADASVCTWHGKTPLILASCSGRLETVQCLLDHPPAAATINRRATYGWTALWHVCFSGRDRLARALLERGADPTIADHCSVTPLAVSKQRGHRTCMEVLEVSFLLFPPVFPGRAKCRFRRLCSVMLGKRS
jgi:uncharacterized protein